MVKVNKLKQMKMRKVICPNLLQATLLFCKGNFAELCLWETDLSKISYGIFPLMILLSEKVSMKIVKANIYWGFTKFQSLGST